MVSPFKEATVFSGCCVFFAMFEQRKSSKLSKLTLADNFLAIRSPVQMAMVHQHRGADHCRRWLGLPGDWKLKIWVENPNFHREILFDHFFSWKHLEFLELISGKSWGFLLLTVCKHPMFVDQLSFSAGSTSPFLWVESNLFCECPHYIYIC